MAREVPAFPCPGEPVMQAKAEALAPRREHDRALIDVPRPRRANKMATPPPPQDAPKNAARLDPTTRLPSTSRKKRRRRSAVEIDRKFKCSAQHCAKAYGSEGSLIHHERLKHPELAQAEAQEKKENQVETFFLPLPNAPRTIAIRPAMALRPDPPLMASRTPHMSAMDFRSPVYPTAQRSRSHSEPVPLLTATATALRALGTTPRVRTRRVVTPRATRPKIRSKSETVSDPLATSPSQAFVHPVDASVTSVEPPFTSLDAPPRAATAWPVAGSSDEHVLDREILSVLAIDETELSDFSCTPPSYPLTLDAALMPVGMDCFKLLDSSTDTPGLTEPEAEGGLPALPLTGRDEWRHEAGHLSTHLEKMSMAQMTSPGLPEYPSAPFVDTLEYPRDASLPYQVKRAVPWEGHPEPFLPWAGPDGEWHTATASPDPLLTCAALDDLLQSDESKAGHGKSELDSVETETGLPSLSL